MSFDDDDDDDDDDDELMGVQLRVFINHTERGPTDFG